MRDNFEPNVRLTTNILFVIATFLIAFNLSSIHKQDKAFMQRRDDCADELVGAIDLDVFDKENKSGENHTKSEFYNIDQVRAGFWNFYRKGTSRL
tara:strand:+ start:31 stop:315 length:285 start_codon:yes stop_codon:yes gene_type:complete